MASSTWTAPHDLPFARRAAELEPTLARRATLVRALLAADKLDEAASLYAELAKQGDTSMGGEVFEKRKQYDELVRWNLERVRAEPDSASRKRALASAFALAGRKNDAATTMLASFYIEAPSRSTLDQMVEWFGTDTAKIDGTLQELRLRHPWNRSIVELIADRMGGADASARRIALYVEARRRHPGHDWPWMRHVGVLLDESRWDEAAKVAAEELAALSNALPGQRANALLVSAWVTRRRAEVQTVPAAAVDEALARIREYERLRGDVTNVVFYRHLLFLAVKRTKDACLAAVERSRLQPDDSGHWWKLVQDCTREAPGAEFVAAKRYLDRNPDDPDRLASLAQVCRQYWGAPISALLYTTRLEQLAPQRDTDGDLGAAYGQLGDRQKQFRLEYLHTHSISQSDRYVDWYESARLGAQHEGNRVDLDLANQSARIRYPNGDVITWREHPVSGRIMEVRRGAAFVRAKYDEIGIHLLGFETGTYSIALTYNGDRTKLQKVAVIAAGQEIESVVFGYDHRGRESTFRVRSLDPGGSGTYRKVYSSDSDTSGTRQGDPRVRAAADRIFSLFGTGYRTFTRRDISSPPELPFSDFDTRRLEYELGQLETATGGLPADKRAAGAARAHAKRLELARRLVELAQTNSQYDSGARRRIRELFAVRKLHPALAIEAVALHHALLRKMRPQGVTGEEATRFAEHEMWIRQLAEAKSADAKQAQLLVRTLDAHPITVLDSERLLPETVYASPSSWSRSSIASLLADGVAGAQPRTALVRENGDVVVGTSRGLLVHTRGTWIHLAYDAKLGHFAPAHAASASDPSSQIESLAEGKQLWIGTRGGLYSLAEYDAPPQRASTLVASAIAVRKDNTVLVGHAHGATWIDGARQQPVAGLPDAAVSAVRQDGSTLWLATTAGLFEIRRDQPPKRLGSDVPTAIEHTYRSGALWTVVDGKLGSHGWSRTSTRTLRDARITGTGRLWVEDGFALVALTDRGVWVDVGSRLERLDVPALGNDRFMHVAASERSLALVGADAIVLWREQGVPHAVGRVHDLLTLPQHRITLAATAYDGLLAFDHDDPRATPETIPGIYGAQKLALAKDGTVIVATAVRVSRLDPRTGKVTPLYEQRPTDAPDGSYSGDGKLTGLLAASDGSVWSTVGASAYRWKDGTVEEFSIFKDPARFPARSWKISRVVETLDNKIWVVASNEGHLRYQGTAMMGGLLEWTGSEFRYLGKPGIQWFVTAYTPITATEAMVASSSGFTLHHRDGRVSSIYEDLKNQSYIDLVDKQDRGLHLGTRGVRVGADTWIFGTGSGVIAYRRGADRKRDRWELLERLNAMLPDPWLLERGGRHVHAVETDPRGRIYVGTDRGLLIAESVALADESTAIVARAQRAALQLDRHAIGDIAAVAPEARVLLDAERALAALVAQRSYGLVLAKQDGEQALDAAERTRLDAKIEEQRKAVDAAATALRGARPALAAMLAEPGTVDELRASLAADRAVVRYAATDRTLVIEVVSRDGVVAKRIAVPRGELERRASRAVQRLEAASSRDLRAIARAAALEHGQPLLDDELAWLYDQLVRPIEGALHGKRRVVVVAHGALHTIPFGALVRGRSPRVERAATRFAFVHGWEVSGTAPAAARPGSTIAAASPSALARLSLGGTRMTVVGERLVPAQVRALALAGTGAVLAGPDNRWRQDVARRVWTGGEDPAEAMLAVQRAAIAAGSPLGEWASLQLYVAP